MMAVTFRKSPLWGAGVNFIQAVELPYKATDSPQNSSSINTVARATPEIWHTRLGHPSISRLTAFKDVLFFDSSVIKKSHPSSICPLAKQRRFSFEPHNNRTAAIFDMIHADVWGPFSTCSHAGYQDFLTIVDDHSRYTWIFLMKKKDFLSNSSIFCICRKTIQRKHQDFEVW